MGGGISFDESRLVSNHHDSDKSGGYKEWKILLTKEELIEKYNRVDGVTINDPGHLELRSVKFHSGFLSFVRACLRDHLTTIYSYVSASYWMNLKLKKLWAKLAKIFMRLIFSCVGLTY